MNFYDKHIVPRLVHFVCGQQPAMKQRQKIVPLARGRVLEIGLGSGLNLALYDAGKVDVVLGLEPSAEMRRLAAPAVQRASFSVELIDAPAESIPLAEATIDTVLVTYTLCTIPDVGTALAEMRRVLKPDGALCFCEHGLSPDRRVRTWQHRMTPLWRALGGGCHLNRPIPDLLHRTGFSISGTESGYIPGFRPASYNFWGQARPAIRG